jgi:acetyl-CoA synthetase
MREPFAWQPDAGTVADATLTAFIAHHGLAGYDALLERSTSDPAWFWNAVIDWFGIAFSTPYDAVMDSDDGAPWTRWCVGGETNLAANCLDAARHDDAMPAIAWEAEDGTTRHWSRAELRDATARLVHVLQGEGITRHWSRAELRDATARLVHVLQGEGIGPGDAVGLYLPMLPETVAAFFAVAALGGVVVRRRRGLADHRVDPAPWTPGRDEAGRRRHCGTGTDVASNAGAARRTGRRA